MNFLGSFSQEKGGEVTRQPRRPENSNTGRESSTRNPLENCEN